MFRLTVVREYEKDGEKKTSFTDIGVAFPLKNGDGFLLKLNALPLGDTIIMKEDDGRGKRQYQGRDRGRGNGYGKDRAREQEGDTEEAPF